MPLFGKILSWNGETLSFSLLLVRNKVFVLIYILLIYFSSDVSLKPGVKCCDILKDGSGKSVFPTTLPPSLQLINYKKSVVKYLLIQPVKTYASNGNINFTKKKGKSLETRTNMKS